MRQSVWLEMAWANSVVSRSPRKGSTSSRRAYHCMRACSAAGEWASVRFMLVTRPWAVRCRSSSSRAAAGTWASGRGGILAIADLINKSGSIRIRCQVNFHWVRILWSRKDHCKETRHSIGQRKKFGRTFIKEKASFQYSAPDDDLNPQSCKGIKLRFDHWNRIHDQIRPGNRGLVHDGQTDMKRPQGNGRASGGGGKNGNQLAGICQTEGLDN